MSRTSRYWFATSKYGWGWGLPTAWQGWAVYTAYVAALGTLWFAFPPDKEPTRYAVLFTVISLALVAVCEPPRWRWGGD